MNLSEANTLITFNTNTDTTIFPNTERVIFMNSALDEIHTDILSSEDGWDFDDKNASDFPILSTDTVANQQDYSLPSNLTGSSDDIIRIKRVEIKYDNRFYKAEPFDKGEMGDSIIEDVDSNFSKTAPKYDMSSGSIFLYPAPTSVVTSAIKIWIDRSLAQFASTDLTSTTKSFGYDRQFHEIIPLKVSLNWMMAKTPNDGNKINVITQRIEQLTAKMREYYGSKQQDRQIVLKAGYIDYDTDLGGGSNRYGPN